MNQQENTPLQIFLEHSVNNPGNLIKRSQITVFVDQLHKKPAMFDYWELCGTELSNM